MAETVIDLIEEVESWSFVKVGRTRRQDAE
jgi:hypothetical protein